MTRFSDVYQIILNSRTEKDLMGTFNILLGWYEYKNSSSLINHYGYGKNKITRNYVIAFTHHNGINGTKKSIIDNHLVDTIIDKTKLTKDLLDQIKLYSIDNESVDYLISLSKDDYPLFLASVIYLAVTDKNSLSDVLDSDNNSEFIYAEEQELFRKTIWNASQQEYFISHRKGNRFANLNIIETLLPKGYVEPAIMEFHFDCSNEKLKKIKDIYDATSDNIAITGEGGIGKTTFLQKLLEISYGTELKPKSYTNNCIIPIFIELNRCPKNINGWFESQYNKTNFITRCIADYIQHLNVKYRDYDSLLTKLENEFRTDLDGKAHYLLLLDGFNEVSTENNSRGESIRAILSHEITELQKLPNIRIITTSRVTQSAYYAANFTRVHLNGLEPEDIKKYLNDYKYHPMLIDQITNNTSLMRCLSVPLFLYMFSFQNDYSIDFVPETYGEIMYNFFHKDGNFYNLRKRSAEANNNPVKHIRYMTEIILDFIVPYIAWYFIRHDTFSISRPELRDCIKEAFKKTSDWAYYLTYCPLSDFKYDSLTFQEPLNYYRFDSNDNQIVSDIISCIHNYLGIIYSYETKNNDKIKIRYSFVHHHFRDYFSAIWNVNTLRLLPYVHSDFDEGDEFYPDNLFECHWNNDEAETIGQILQEHRNKPIYNKKTGNWSLPTYEAENQNLLTDILDHCRKNNSDISIYDTFLTNIINTLNICRGELSGVCFDQLDLQNCKFHNITCSKKGNSSFLSATFNEAKVSSVSFSPKEHFNLVSEYHYIDNMCITMDQDNVIKIWDVLSGNQITQIHCFVEHELPDYDSVNYIRFSADKKFLALKVQLSDKAKNHTHILVYDFLNNSVEPFSIELPRSCKKITDFTFRESDNSIIALADDKELLIYTFHEPDEKYSFIRYTLSSRKKIKNLYRNSVLFTYKEDSIYIFSYDLNLFDTEYELLTKDDPIDDSDDEEMSEPVTCSITKYSLSTNRFELIYEYKSSPYTRPACTFIPRINSFIIYNNDNQQLQLFDCQYHETNDILQTIISENDGEMPSTIHCEDSISKSCYIMYPYTCYKVVVNKSKPSQVIEKIDVPEIETDKNIPSSDELLFLTNTAPCNNRFLLRNDAGNTYEWHVEYGSPKYKYNTRLFDTVGLFKDNTRDLFMLVHQQNGISIFSQSTCKLINSYCFGNDEDYLIVDADYSKQTGLLFLLFVRGKHNYIQSINIDTSESMRIFSKPKPSDEATHLCVSENGRYVLISDQVGCYEYSITNDQLNTVYISNRGEIITEAFYTDSLINIGIARARNYLEPEIDPVCEIYSRCIDNTYKFEFGYFIPTLDKSLSKSFIHKIHDLGTPCSLNPNGIQDYWITKGFFTHSSTEIDKLLDVRCFIKDSPNARTPEQYKDLSKFTMILVKHDFALENKDLYQSDINSYSYLANDFSEATFIYDYQLVTHYTDLKNYPAYKVTFDYKSNPELAEEGSKYWDIALPLDGHRFICCAENYRLFLVDGLDGRFVEEINYFPGLAICGCKFHNANISADCKNTIISNGGIL